MDTATPASNTVSVLINLESLIKNHMSSLTNKKQELKKLKEMLNDGLTANPAYKSQDDQVKAETKKRSQIKSQLMSSSELMELSQKVKNLSPEVKETNSALSDYLREYARHSGVNEITDDSGEIHEIVYLAKLIKKSTSKFSK